MGSDTDEVRGDEGPLSMTWSPGRVLAVVAMLAIVLFWAWVFSGAPAKENPDYLERDYAATVEARCQQLRDDLDELPSAVELPDRIERAEVLDEANVLVDEFLDDLEADAPSDGPDATAMEGWLADWRTYLGDREAYAEQLRADEGDRFTVTESPLGDTVDRTIEVFADVNQIPACATPGDVG